MAANRRHHYVPQFYLKRFSKGKPFIACFNKSAGRRIGTVPVKGQCQIPRYYDWNPDVEKTLSILESAAAALMRHLDVSRSLRTLHASDWELLITFIALQAARTKATGDSNDKFTDYFAKMVSRGAPELKDFDLDSIYVKNTFPTALPIEVMLQASSVFGSLSVSLLENNTNFPFLGSDNPVVRYNSQRRQIRHEGTIGLDSPGLQILYPISPTLAIYMFDPKAYKPPSNTGFRVIGRMDAIKICMLQMLWADENLYFDDEMNFQYLLTAHERLRPFYKWERIKIIESKPIQSAKGGSESIIINFQPHSPIEIQFDFSKIRMNYDPDYVGRSNPRRRFRPSGDNDSVRYEIEPEKPRAHFTEREVQLLSAKMN